MHTGDGYDADDSIEIAFKVDVGGSGSKGSSVIRGNGANYNRRPLRQRRKRR